MAKKLTLEEIRPETSAEAALREWFEKAVLASPDRLEAAARLLTGLVTTLLGLLFGVLAVADNPLPGYLSLPALRSLGVVSVIALLVCLLAALFALLPFPWQARSGMPADQERVFYAILKRKDWALFVAVLAFMLGVVSAAAAFILALCNA